MPVSDLGASSPGGSIVRTVLGDIPAADLGVTMCHEHLLVRLAQLSFREPSDPRDRAMAGRPISIDMLGWLQWNWMSNLDNLDLDSESLAIAELAMFREAGGRSLVDCTLPGIGRDPLALARISRATGVNVVMGSGYYVEATHPAAVAAISAEAIADEIIREVRHGVDDTGIRAGSIGEIGSSWPITSEETKVFRAAGLAQAELGCGLSVHPGRHPDSPFQVIEILRDAGADMERVVVGHVERTVMEHDRLRQIGDAGCFIEYDLFGMEVTATHPYQAAGIDIPSDAQRLDSISALVRAGYGNRILVSHDVCTKHRTRRYGGLGYDHIVRDIVPWMRLRGFDPASIDRILVDNPRRAFAMPVPG
jgi:phosphotriesterase-related protein